MKYRLQDLINMEQFQNLQDRLNEIYSFPSAIVDNDGNILTATAWQDICTQFHSKHEDCERECRLSDQYILSHIHEANPAVSYRCPHGLVDNATPIVIDGIHYGNFFTGQFFLEKPDMDFFRVQAKKYGFEEDAYLKAVEKVPIWSQKQLDNYLFFIKGLIAVISESGLKKLKEMEARKQIEDSEERANTILRTAMDGFWLVDTQGRVLEVNDAYCQMSGYTRAELLRMSMSELVTSKSSSAIAAEMEMIRQTGSARFETRHQCKDGRFVHFEASVNYLPTSDGRYFCFLRDITERKAQEAEIERLSRLNLALSQVNQLITRVKTREQLLDGVCEMLVKYGQFKMVWIGWLDTQTKAVNSVAQHGDIGGYLKQIKVCADDSAYGRGPTGTAIRESRSVVCNDFIRDASTEPWHDAGARQGIGSSAAFPIRSDGVVCGALTVYAGEQGYFRDKEVSLFEEAAMDVSFALDHLEQEMQRHRAEEAQKQSERLNKTLLDNIPDPAWIKAIDGRFLEVNNAWCQVAGLLREKAVGRDDLEIFPPAIAAQFQEQDRFVVESGQPQYWEEPVPDSRGNGLLFETFKAPLTDSTGKTTGTIGIARNITERKRTEEALRNNQQNLESLFNAIGESVCLFEPNGIILAVNKTFAERLGRRITDCVGTIIYNLIPPDVAASRQAIVAKVLQTGLPEVFEDERYGHWLSHSIYPVLNADGSVARLVVYATDITQRRRSEEALRESEERMRNFFDLGLIGMALSSIEKGWLLVNNRLCEILGYSREALLHKTWAELTYPDDLHLDVDQFNKVLRGEMDAYSMEKRFIRADGVVVNTDMSVCCVRRADRSVRHFVAMFQDISERKQMEEKLRQAQKMEAIGQLAGGVAHDFNNIMAATMMQLSFLKRNTSLDPEAREILNEMMDGAKRAASLTSQLLMFSRRSVMEIQSLDLNEVVANLFKMLSRLIGEHISLRFDRAEALPAVEADARMIEQVVMNVAVNARDAMPKGGLLTIRLETVQIDAQRAEGKSEVQPGLFVCLSVTDTGCGMDEATLKRIFEPFFTTKEVGKGTGLGLATVHGIVAQHKGWVDVESEQGKGTTFKVYFPASTKGNALIQTEEQKIVRGHETILLVEDEAGLRRLVAQGLRLLGYRVLEADNGQTAMKLWQEHGPQIDLLFSDMVMPEGLTGLDLAEKLRQAKPNLKVIISSGYNVETAGHSSQSAGGIVYLKKPYEVEMLSKTVRDCLDGE